MFLTKPVFTLFSPKMAACEKALIAMLGVQLTRSNCGSNIRHVKSVRENFDHSIMSHLGV